jgi:uncharacterized protein YfaS (alpha-2-macroglobulin family)
MDPKLLQKVTAIIVLLGLLGGCGPATTPSPTPRPPYVPPPPGTVSPVIIQRTPEPGEELPLDGAVELVFDRPMDRESVEAAFSIANVRGSFEWRDERTLRFKPAQGLERDAEYEVYLAPTARDIEGQPLDGAYTFRFRTVGYLEVSQVIPAPGSADVAADGTITLMFNRPVVPLLAPSDPARADLPNPVTFDPPIAGRGEWLNTSIYVFTPDEPLAGGTTYTGRVAAGLADTTGGLLAETYTWSFSTQPPGVVWVTPTEGATLVPVDGPIQVTFNMPVDPDSAQRAFSLRRPGLLGERVAGTFAVLSDTLIFTPSARLSFDQEYVVTIGAGLRGLGGGRGMPDDYSWRFTTVPLPRILSTDPADGQQNASPYTPFIIYFNTRIDPATVMPNLEMEPPLSPTSTYTYYNDWDNSFILGFDVRPSTDYTVRIGPNIADPYGNTTGQEMTVRFRTAPLDPAVWLNLPDVVGTYSAYEPARLFVGHLNVNRVNLALYRLTTTEYFAAREDWYDYNPPSSALLRRWSVPVEAARNEMAYTPVDLVEGGGRLEPGLYVLELRADGVSFDRWLHRHVLAVSAINLTVKSDERETLVWATDLETGAPVSGLRLSAYNYTGTRYGTATTDDDGLATLPGYRNTGWLSILVIGDEPFTMGSPDWNNGISIWEFGLSAESLSAWRGHIYTDRPIYRPGQTVHFRGILRQEADVHYTLPPNATVQVTVYDAAYQQVYQEYLPLDEFGAFTGEVALAEGASLGQYSIEATVSGQVFYGYFQVAAYRPPEFEVVVTPRQAEIPRGQSTQATVEVRYFFGGPVANAPVEWHVMADQGYRFAPDQFGRYTFTDTDDPWVCFDCWWYSGPGPTVILSGSGTTDAEGRLTIAIPANLRWADGEPITQSVRLTVEATVTGNDGQVISGRADLIVHRGEFYIGLAPREYVGRAGEEMKVDVVTVDWAGDRLPGRRLDFTVYRREWINTWVENGSGGGEWRWETSDTPVASGTLTTSAQAEGVVAFTPPQGGAYRVVVRGRDARERLVQSSLFAWASGPEYVSWRRSNDDRITLISDRSTYRPGDTAEILIPSPYAGEQWALVTVERGTILQREVVRLESNSTIYRLPITAEHVPNVYVGVVIVQGRQAALAAAQGGPAVASHKVGYVALTVEPEPQTLSITATPSTAQAEPGAQVTYDIRVTDATGEPVATSLSLDLVDKAVLSLQPRTPNAIVEAFYGRRGLGITTGSGLAVSVNRLLLEQIEEMLRESGAGAARGGGAEVPIVVAATPAMMLPAPREAVSQEAYDLAALLPAGVELRQEFADTAYWNGSITTAADGTAQVTVDLPDNLTTWVFRAVGVTRATQVGEATSELLVTKPLLIRPVAPRFFVVGDHVRLAAIVNNNTDQALDVTVTMASTGLTLDETRTTQHETVVTIPAGTEQEVAWWVTVDDVPQVELAFAAVSGEYSDAARPRLTTGPDGTLLVYRYTAPEIVGTGGQLVGEGSRTEAVAVPPRYDNRRGELSIRLDPSLAAGMQDGLDYLEHFEYECTEQTVSRFLPNVLTYRALQELGIADPELEARLPGLVHEGLDRLYLQQHDDGGWGWWSNDDSNPYLTAYVIFALDKAAEAGFEVRSDVLSRGLDFLSTQLVAARDLRSYQEANRQAWILYVMAEAGRTGQASERTDDLYAAREKLSHYGRAFLALTLSLIRPEDSRIATLLSDIQNAAILSATGAHWEEREYDWWAMNTDTRSTAVILDALARLDPQNDLIPNVVRWLMVARQEGIWETTQETAWALIALTDWMRVTGELRGQYDYGVQLNDEMLASGNVTPENVRESVRLSVDVADLLAGSNRLTIGRGPGEGRLYYTAHLRVFLPVEEIEPLNRGIIVSRQYCRTMNNGAMTDDLPGLCEEVDQAQVGETVQVRLTIIAPHDLYYVVVEDPLPAGAEAVDTSLATTSLLEQEPGITPVAEAEGSGWRSFYWWWWRWYSRSELRDEKVVLFADYLPAGTYTYQYTFRATQAGEYRVIPTSAHEFYFPEVFGRGDGRLFTVTQ